MLFLVLPLVLPLYCNTRRIDISLSYASRVPAVSVSVSVSYVYIYVCVCVCVWMSAWSIAEPVAKYVCVCVRACA